MTSRRTVFLLKSLGCTGLFTLLIALSWQNTLSSPAIKPPDSLRSLKIRLPDIEPTVAYPDSFGFRSEYLTQFSIKRHIVRQGDSLHKVFRKLGLSTDYVAQWKKACNSVCRLTQIQPGDELIVYSRLQDRELAKLIYSPAKGSTHIFRKSGDKWICQEEEVEPISITRAVRGTITDSLYDSCRRAGLPPKTIGDLADLFAYDIDFATDLRQGDTFAVYFKQEVKNGKSLHVDPILAAEMKVNSRTYQAFYFRSPDGHEDYYDINGRSLRKSFLKAPLQYSRISSTFTYSRRHPILRICRPHLGIDYAAPTGTPVSALGDGTVTFLGTKGGFGRYIEIVHDSTFKTTYGHLSGFAAGLRNGSKVQQGQIIGYVGSSGLATGPHLDFRFYKDGIPIDYLKSDFSYARSIPESLQGEFKKTCRTALAALHEDKHLAMKETSDISDNE